MSNGEIVLNTPFMISFNISGFAYNDGFRKPIGPFPAFNLSSLSRFTTAAKIGVLADVPPERLNLPPT
jgi:hypothetical protein